MVKEKEVIKALKTIKKVCISCKDCSECMLRNNNNLCGVFVKSDRDLIYTPSEWILKEDKNPRVILN